MNQLGWLAYSIFDSFKYCCCYHHECVCVRVCVCHIFMLKSNQMYERLKRLNIRETQSMNHRYIKLHGCELKYNYMEYSYMEFN